MARRRKTSFAVGVVAAALVGFVAPVYAEGETPPVDSTSVDTTQPPTGPVDTSQPPAETVPVETVPVESVPVETAPADTVPTVTTVAPVDEADLVRVIVTFDPRADVDADAPDSPVAGMQVTHVYEEVLDGAAVAATPEQIEELKADPDVKSVVLDRPVRATYSWALDRIDQRSSTLTNSFTPPGTGSGVYIYIVDSGIRATHPEFGGRVVAGENFVPVWDPIQNAYTLDPTDSDDCDGHGTHVAGTAGGSTYGVARSATLVPIRVLDCDGAGWSSSIIAGLDHIRQTHPAGTPAVVNMSLGLLGGRLSSLDQAVQRLVAAGIPVVVAAGNSNLDACTRSPGGVPQAITVGATDQSDRRAGFSNWGTCLDLFAPGVNITSSYPSSSYPYVNMGGTSMAAPHVAGAIAVFAQGSTTAASAAAYVVNSATLGVVTDTKGSPNKLLYVGSPEVMSVATSSLPVAMRNTSYSVNLQAQGSQGPYTWKRISGSLPRGLSLSSAGQISGRPSSASSSTFTVQVTSRSGNSVNQELTISVVPTLSISTRTMPRGTVNTPYSATLAATGGSGPYSWSLSGSLPPGVMFAPNGTISGTPTAGGTYRFTTSVIDANGFSVSKSFTVSVTAPRSNSRSVFRFWW